MVLVLAAQHSFVTCDNILVLLTFASTSMMITYIATFPLFLLVQYILHIYGYLKEWRKNPQWSLSCCLALFLPLISLPGDISGLVETNIINSQLDTGDIEMPTIKAAVEDTGIMDAALEETEEGENISMGAQDDSCNVAQPQTGGEEIRTNVTAVQGRGKVNFRHENDGNDCKPAETQDDTRSDAQPKTGGMGKPNYGTALRDMGTEEGQQGNVNHGMTQDVKSVNVQDTNRVNSNPENEDKEMPSNAGSVQATESANATLGEGRQGGGDSVNTCGDNSAVGQPKNEKKKLASNTSAVQNSGAVDVTSEGYNRKNMYPPKLGHDFHNAAYSAKKDHQGTQTKLLTIFAEDDIMFHEPMQETHF